MPNPAGAGTTPAKNTCAMLDVVGIGEAMLRLSPPRGETLEAAAAFEVRAAGAEANVAVALARMGFRTGWISRLADGPLGRRIAAELRRHGVDLAAVVWTPQARTGLYFLEPGVPPRAAAVHYDRAGSAASALGPDDVDWTYVRRARWIHLTGITPALSASCAATTARAIQEARAAGVHVAFDVNYRRRLWSAARARAALDPLLAGADLVICASDDAREVFALDGPAGAQAAALRARTGAGAAVVTAGRDGAYLARDGSVVHEPAIPGEELDRIGRGDAFAAGVLWGALEEDLGAGLRYGAALAALAQTYYGDIAWSTRADVLHLLADRGLRPDR
ncbi:MAG: sugar kinase [Armatimonadota bacterium]|nr:sugar kinase [Armatimonadota bacterium]MDR7485985.1 sugar kinase [Armatimonadota bacterium]MDR7533514.1 sugar kinase [Armatimonadota bacterium]MDR7536896.1 sugar kinase [Armatimonadota bacterium]